MSEIRLTADEARSAIASLSKQVEKLDGAASAIGVAHRKLLLDDIFSIADYSAGLLSSLHDSHKKLKKLKQELESCEKIANAAITELVEADMHSGGNQSGASAQVGGSWKPSGWKLIGSLLPLPISVIPLISRLFSGESDSISTEITVLDHWDGKEEFEKRSGEMEKYYKEIEEGYREAVKKLKPSVNDYSAGVRIGEIRWVNQNDPEGWDGVEWRLSQCNSGCESMALSYMGIDRSPGSMTPAGGVTGFDPMGGLEVASYNGGHYLWTSDDGSVISIDSYVGCDMEKINAGVDAFKQDARQGDVAPMMVHYSDGGTMHWVLITGRNADGTYRVTGPGGFSER